LIIFCIKSGNGAAVYSNPFVKLEILPVANSTATSSPSLIAFAASGHSKIGSPMLIAFL